MYSFKFSRIKALKWHQVDENRLDIKILKGFSEKLIVNMHNNSELVALKPKLISVPACLLGIWE